MWIMLITLWIMGGVGALITMNDPQIALLFWLGMGVVLFGLKLMADRRDDQVELQWIIEDVWICDWGTLGSKAKGMIPEELSGCPIIFVPAKEVRRTADMMDRRLRTAGNKFIGRTVGRTGQEEVMEVRTFYFRDPKEGDVSETGEEYLERIFVRIKEDRQKYLSAVRKTISEEEFVEVFFESHKMGSRM